MKMKRILAAALSGALLLTLAACQQPSQTNTGSPAPSPQTVTLTRDNFPRLDGSTSTAPLGRAIASVLLGESEDDVADLIHFSRTSESFRQLMQGNSDLLIVAEPSPNVLDELDAAGFEIQMEPFANDGLVFVVNADNPVDSLTVEQLRDIYTGKITNWKEVGGDDLEIAPFQRNAESGSQVLMEKLVMDGQAMMEPPEGYMLSEMGMASGLKILRVDGVNPSADAIRSGEYPLRNPYYVAMAANTPDDDLTSILYHWILSQEGQKLVDQMGYASVLEVG